MYILLFLTSLGFSFMLPSIHDNFTHLYNEPATKLLYMIWIITLSIFLLVKCKELYARHVYQNKIYKYVLYGAFVSMMLGAIVPYGIEIPILSSIHVLLSLLASVLTLVVVKLLIDQLQFIDPMTSHGLQQLYLFLISATFMFTMIFGSISSVVELVLIGSILFLVRQIDKTKP